ncbi:MAG: heme exporter protein CcmD [Pseudomonadota bacterium]
MESFFAMGGYALFVWPAILLTLGVMVWLAWSSVAALKRTQRQLRALEGMNLDRRKGRGLKNEAGIREKETQHDEAKA